MGSNSEFIYIGTIIPFCIMTAFLIFSAIKLRRIPIDIHMKVTMILLYISLVFFMFYGAYYTWIKPEDAVSDVLYLLWYASELIEMAAIMFDIARLEITETNRKQVH